MGTLDRKLEYRMFKSANGWTIAGRIKGSRYQTHILETEFEDVAKLILISLMGNDHEIIESVRFKDGKGISYYINGCIAHRIYAARV